MDPTSNSHVRNILNKVDTFLTRFDFGRDHGIKYWHRRWMLFLTLIVCLSMTVYSIVAYGPESAGLVVILLSGALLKVLEYSVARNGGKDASD